MRRGFARGCGGTGHLPTAITEVPYARISPGRLRRSGGEPVLVGGHEYALPLAGSTPQAASDYGSRPAHRRRRAARHLRLLRLGKVALRRGRPACAARAGARRYCARRAGVRRVRAPRRRDGRGGAHRQPRAAELRRGRRAGGMARARRNDANAADLRDLRPCSGALRLHEQCRRARCPHANDHPPGTCSRQSPLHAAHAAGVRIAAWRTHDARRHATEHRDRDLSRGHHRRGVRHVRFHAGGHRRRDRGARLYRPPWLAVDPAPSRCRERSALRDR